MEFINVSQFYESVLCFAIPLLLIQRIILYCFNLSDNYEEYRRQFYEDEFKFTKEFEYAGDEQVVPIEETTMRDTMLDKNKVEENKSEMRESEVLNMSEIRERISSFSIANVQEVVEEEKIDNPNMMKKKNKIDIVLETDKELKNESLPNKTSNVPPNEKEQNTQKEANQTDQVVIEAKEDDKSNEKNEEEIIDEVEVVEEQKESANKIKEKEKKIEVNEPSIIVQEIRAPENEEISVGIEESRASRLTQSEIEVRRETRLERGSLEIEGSETENERKEKVVIELGRGSLQEKGEKDRIRMKYCRRIDDAFNDYVPVILCVIVLGMLTRSVYIYSMCCFFGYAFTSLLFNYAHLLDRLEGSTENKSLFGRANHLIASLFIFGLFISYWISSEYD